MRPQVLSCLAALLLAAPGAHAQTGAVSFNLSTSKSFAPG